MTTDDSLLLSDLDRVASDVVDALTLEAYQETENYREPIEMVVDDLARALSCLRRAEREMVTLRERLERRLKA